MATTTATRSASRYLLILARKDEQDPRPTTLKGRLWL